MDALLIVLIVALALFLVHAMMELSLALWHRPRPARLPAVDAATLRQRLLELAAGAEGWSFRERAGADLEPCWSLLPDEKGAGRPAEPGRGEREAGCGRVVPVPRYTAWLLLDEERREVRWYQHIRSGGFYLGWYEGWPRFNWPLFFSAGPATPYWAGVALCMGPGPRRVITDIIPFERDLWPARDAIEHVIARAGWTIWPVLLWFLALRRPLRFFRFFVPRPLRRWPTRRFWALVYPAAFLALLALLVVAVGGPAAMDRRDWLILALVTAGWWLVWGGLALLLVRVRPAGDRPTRRPRRAGRAGRTGRAGRLRRR